MSKKSVVQKTSTANSFWIASTLILLVLLLAVSSVYVAQSQVSTQGISQAAGGKLLPSTTHQTEKTAVQTIKLASGWNIISLNVVPRSYDSRDPYDPYSVFRTVIEKNIFLLVKNNAGQIFFPQQQTNQIGNLQLGEGYEVFVITDTEMTVAGTKVPLPVDIGLGQGWNIISYPSNRQVNALAVVKPIIKDNTLVEVRDSAGRRIYKNGRRWVNEIGSFLPGQGYKVYTAKAGVLVINK